jgi:AbrB family looped-hinge helix DNA binding protein
MRITSKGQVTIPQEIREKFGFLPDTEVEFIARKNSVQIVKADKAARPTRGELLVRRLRGRASGTMSTDEIMALTRNIR